jgi:serine/threonine protein kinase
VPAPPHCYSTSDVSAINPFSSGTQEPQFVPHCGFAPSASGVFNPSARIACTMVLRPTEKLLHTVGAAHEGPPAGLGSAGRAGTPSYMAPELFGSGQPSASSDLYAAGATLATVSLLANLVLAWLLLASKAG